MVADFPGIIPEFVTKDVFRDEIDPARETEFINGRDMNEIYDEIVAISKNLGASLKFEPCLTGTELIVASGTSYIKTKRIEYAGDVVTVSGTGFFWVDNTATLKTGSGFPSGTEFIPIAQVLVSGSTLTLIDERIFVGASFPVGDAADVTYTPGDPSDWPVPLPTTVEEGLDSLADQVAGFGVFGQNYDYSESESEFSDGSGSYVEAHTLPSYDTPDGVFHVGWSFEFSGNLVGPQNISVKVEIDDTPPPIGEVMSDVILESGTWRMASGFRKIPLSSGTHKIDIDIKSDTPSGSVFIRRARIEAWRVP